MVSKETGLHPWGCNIQYWRWVRGDVQGDLTPPIKRFLFIIIMKRSLADWHSEIPWRPLSCLLGSTASVVSSWVPTTIPNHCPAGIHALPRWFPDTPRSPAWLSAAAEEADWDSLSIALNYHDSVMSCFTDKASGLGYWSFLQSTPYPPNPF